MREFEQMELEWFCKPDQVEKYFEFWTKRRKAFYQEIGISPEKIRLREHDKGELAHYSSRCIDVEYEFPFGWKELEGMADRGSFDLQQHSNHSGKDLSVYDDETKESYMPHIVECSVGTDRLFLTLLFDAYTEDIVEGEPRVMLKLHPKLAPIKAAFFPLVKKLNDPMFAIYQKIKKNTGFQVTFDDTGSIGKRYRRQDEIGTPVCFTYDFDSENDHCVTVRHRDTTQQERIKIDALESYLRDLLTK
jgi:glycyl-tRNA synthetase